MDISSLFLVFKPGHIPLPVLSLYFVEQIVVNIIFIIIVIIIVVIWVSLLTLQV